MKVDPEPGGGARVVLTAREVLLLRTALERASFVDTPVQLQGPTLDFAERLLKALPVPPR
ncbi:MAG: hypothetical protein L0216_05295 [Planctomycetales bacterium]|nr:hypothetical protein [Planctomycetales bacterium]